MSFCKLNGCVAPIADGSTKRDSEAFAKDTESLFNNQIPRFTDHKDSFALALQKSSAEVSNSLAGLINGEGAHWPLTTHLWSSNGHGPEDGFTVAVIGGANPFGAVGYMSITDATFDVGLSELWTVMVWRLEGAAWTHYFDGMEMGTSIKDILLDKYNHKLYAVAWYGPRETSTGKFFAHALNSDYTMAQEPWYETNEGLAGSALYAVAADDPVCVD